MKKNLTTILFALVAMLMPNALGATEYEKPDFSDAKVLTASDGLLYADGAVLESSQSISGATTQIIPGGKYKLESDISTHSWVILKQGEMQLDLNGYTWDLNEADLKTWATLSIYDTSPNESGKICGDRNVIYVGQSEEGLPTRCDLYSGTLESRGAQSTVLDASWGSANLYGGTLKGNGYGVFYYMDQSSVIKVVGTAIDNGADRAHVRGWLPGEMAAAAIIDVSEYKGDSMSVSIEITDTEGRIPIIQGIVDAQAANLYQLEVVCDSVYGMFCEKEEYDPSTGKKYIHITASQFTQQPTAENLGTVGFNNPAATLQWYEVEQTILTDTNTTPLEENTYVDGYWRAQENVRLFEFEAKAGDVLHVKTTAELELLVIDAGRGSIQLTSKDKTGTYTIETDTRIVIWIPILLADTEVDLQFAIFRETLLPNETSNQLQQATHGKTYYCKATVGKKVYISDLYQYQAEALWGASADELTESGTLAEAFQAVARDSKVKYVQLQSQPKVTEAYVLWGAVCTLDLNGYTITHNGYPINLYSDQCDVTILDSSAEQTGMIVTTESGGAAVDVNYGAKLTIQSGAYHGTYASITVDDESSLHIQGGRFVGTYYAIDTYGDVLIEDGEFVGGDAATIGIFGADKKVTIRGGIWQSSYRGIFEYRQGTLDLSHYPTEASDAVTPLKGMEVYVFSDMAVVGKDILLPEGYSMYDQDMNPVEQISAQGVRYTIDETKADVETSLEKVTGTDEAAVQKTLRNGQLLIMRDGVAYDVMGNVVLWTK